MNVYDNLIYSALNGNGGGGGGGSSNIVTGEFIAKDGTGEQVVTIPYNGTGYPIAGFIYLTGGLESIKTLRVSRAYETISMLKVNPASTPTYSEGASDEMAVSVIYQSSNYGTFIGNSAQKLKAMKQTLATTSTTSFAITSANTILFNIAEDNSVYGLFPNTSYSYYIMYSE